MRYGPGSGRHQAFGGTTMIYTRQQGAQDARDYVAAVLVYAAGTTGDERSDALALWTVCHPYALEQWDEWPEENEVCPRPVTLDAATLKQAS
jgi:hypothetical protein